MMSMSSRAATVAAFLMLLLAAIQTALAFHVATTTTTTTTTRLLVTPSWRSQSSSSSPSSSLAFSASASAARYHHYYASQRSGHREANMGSSSSSSSSSSNKKTSSSSLCMSSSSSSSAASASAAVPAENNQKEPLLEGFGKGIYRDYKARLPLYWSDIKDGLNVQCLAAIMFLFFACLAPAVGFGGLFGLATHGAIGTVEMVSSTALCGVIYALTAAQPLTIIGSTGPVLAFCICLQQLSESLSLPFLPLYAWTGLWTAAILFVSAVTSASNLVKYLTRFTDEIFSTLISTIFVVEAVSDVGGTFSTSTFTKALLTLLCATTTFTISTMLKGLRRSTYFTRTIRNTISNFAPTIGVVTACCIAHWAKTVHGVAMAGLPALTVPATFGTTSGRPWLIPLLDLPVWARFAAFLPALMATVLLFLDQNITVRLVNNARFNMRKGRRPGNVLDGMHADMLVIAILTALQSLVGLPWLVAATVRSLSHVSALSKYESTSTDESSSGNSNSNNTPPKIVGTTEQRVTGTAIHALIGCCVLFAKPRQLLSTIPLPVLMGLFLYLGTSGLSGNEMWQRTIGLFQDKTVAPKQRWSDPPTVVPTKVTNIFTMIQLTCLGIMFYVKESQFGVLFPIVIAMLAPLKFALEKSGIVKKEYMNVLDED